MSTVTFNFFAKYLNTSPSARGGVVRRMQQQASEAYHPSKDFWQRMNVALASDRRTTRDGAAVTACAQNNTDPRRAAHFDAVAAAWGKLHHRWDDATAVLEPMRALPIGPLTIGVKPTFVERFSDGRIEVVLVRLAVGELGRDVKHAILRMLELAYPDTTTVFVDVRRGVVLTNSGKRLDHLDPWIQSEAAGLAHLLQDDAA